MRIFILGANGNTGTQLIDLALARGHQVTAFVHAPPCAAAGAARQSAQRE
jgi:putative NADH-flavin reductase